MSVEALNRIHGVWVLVWLVWAAVVVGLTKLV